jgi:hypothetical protein
MLAKYGPMVPLLWKTAGKPATDAAQRAFTSHAARNTALRHADTVQMGAILKVYDQLSSRRTRRAKTSSTSW